jgi:hypothetical protein
VNDVRVSGPMFDVRAQRYVDQMLTEVKQEVGDYGLFLWRMNLEGSLKVQTGRYMRSTQVIWRGQDRVVNDGWPGSGVVYGPWLEGVGSRNSPVTRFPGYFSMRRAVSALFPKVKRIGQPFVDKWIGRINGE